MLKNQVFSNAATPSEHPLYELFGPCLSVSVSLFLKRFKTLNVCTYILLKISNSFATIGRISPCFWYFLITKGMVLILNVVKRKYVFNFERFQLGFVITVSLKLIITCSTVE